MHFTFCLLFGNNPLHSPFNPEYPGCESIGLEMSHQFLGSVCVKKIPLDGALGHTQELMTLIVLEARQSDPG